MTLPKSITSYLDVKARLEEARALGGAKITFATFGAAVSFVARCYTYRKLLKEQALASMENPPPGWAPSTPWDDLIIRHDKKARSPEIIFEFGIRPAGTIQALKPEERMVGESAAPLIQAAPLDDPLLAEALKLLEAEGGPDA